MTILPALGVDDHELTLAELVRRTGLHKATTHRLCGEMVGAHLLDRTSGGSMPAELSPFLQDLDPSLVEQWSEGYGADMHPSAATHERMGHELAAMIRRYVCKEDGGVK